MITYKQLQEMVSLQEQLAIIINGKDWRDKGHNYRLCIFMELAEIVDCFPWKHWKDIQSEPNYEKAADEVVDVWHFVLTYLLQNPEFDSEEFYNRMKEAWEAFKEGNSIEEYVIGIVIMIYAKGEFMLGNFIGLLRLANMTFEDLYVRYISKNVLNIFRQDFGYKNGTYLKVWGGKEDTEHLRELTDELLREDTFRFVTLYDSLKLRYQLLTR
jgi:dimeric dUTPase (all-alpha-NTP-PPase superfamily)